jgi:hypothetical protein
MDQRSAIYPSDRAQERCLLSTGDSFHPNRRFFFQRIKSVAGAINCSANSCVSVTRARPMALSGVLSIITRLSWLNGPSLNKGKFKSWLEKYNYVTIEDGWIVFGA